MCNSENMKNGHKFQLPPPARNKGEEGGSKEVQGLRILAPKWKGTDQIAWRLGKNMAGASWEIPKQKMEVVGKSSK